MNRKQTILIAVLVNAGLLVLLFIMALTTGEDLVSPSSLQIVQSPSAPKLEPVQPAKPLFADLSDQTLREPAPIEPKTVPVVIAPEPQAQHPLPAKVPEPASPPAALKEPALDAKQPVASQPALIPDASGIIEIVVKKGDSLDKLAKEHHTSVSELIKINRLPSSFLRVGQLLKVPAQKKAPVSSKPAPQNVKEEETITYYTVKVGDNPWTIAMKHNMKVEELLRLNGLNEEKARKLKPGDRLRTKYTPGH